MFWCQFSYSQQKQLWDAVIVNNIINSIQNSKPETLQSHTCQLSNEVTFTLKDTVLPLIKENIQTTDTNDIRIKIWKQKNYLFNSTTVTDQTFIKPGKYSENIISSNVSGLSDPIFNYVTLQLQNISFLDTYIKILDKKYINPLSSEGFSKYLFYCENSVPYHSDDILYLCSFTPKDSADNNCLNGYFWLERNNLKPLEIKITPALPDSRISFNVIHKFIITENKSWVLQQKIFNTGFKTGIIKTSDKTFYIEGFGSSNYQNYNFNDSLTIKEASANSSDTLKDHAKSNFLTNLYHSNPISLKDSSVFHLVDSVISDRNYNQRMKLLEALLYGFYPVGGINIDFKKIVGYTRFEGILLGVGVSTNPKVFKCASVGGFFSYGLRSEYLKYGGFIQLFPRWYSDTKLTLRYTNNATETGGYSFLDDYTFNSTEYLRNYFIPKMDKALEKEIAFSFKTLKAIKFNFYLNQSYKTFNNYSFLFNNSEFTSLNITEAGAQLKLSFGEKFMKTPRGRLLSLGSRYPVFWLNYHKGLEIFKGDINYDKIEAKISQKLKLSNCGTAQIQIKAGKIWGDVPLSNTYSAMGCYDKIPFDVENYFATIRPKEFYSNEFLFVFLRHNFGTLFPKNKYFSPELHIVTNAGWGKMSNIVSHQNVVFNTMEKGYWESGVLLHRIINTNLMSLGTGVYYRYGPYSFVKTIDNFALKATFTYTL